MPHDPSLLSQKKDAIFVSRWVFTDDIPDLKKAVRSAQIFAYQHNVPEPRLTITEQQRLLDLASSEGEQGGAVSVAQHRIFINGDLPHTQKLYPIAFMPPQRADRAADWILFSEHTDLQRTQPSRQCMHETCASPNQNGVRFLFRTPGEHLVTCRKCMEKTFGTLNGTMLVDAIRAHELWLNTSKWKETFEKLRKSPDYWVPTTTYLALADAYTQQFGFVKSDMPNATRDLVVHDFQHPNEAPSFAQEILRSSEGPHHQKARIVLSYFRSVESDSEYIGNLKNALYADNIRLSNRFSTGITASAISTYDKAMATLQKNSHKLNEPFGNKKERGRLKLFVNDAEAQEEREHPIVKYRLNDAQGRRFIWRASWPGMEQLKPGTWVYLTATIKSHSEFNGTHYTFLTRCADPEVTTFSSETPNFTETAQKRSFKEQFQLSVDYRNNNGRIDGYGYLRIERHWKEAKKIRHVKTALRLPLGDDLVSRVMKDITEISGVKRSEKEINGTKTHAKDKSFIQYLTDYREHFDEACPRQSQQVYHVDSTFLPLFSPITGGEDRVKTHDNDFTKGQPLLFTSVSEAHRAAQKLQAGRLVTVALKHWQPMVVPIELRLASVGEQRAFKEQCALNGFNAIIFVDDMFFIQRIEPLDWHYRSIPHDLLLSQFQMFHKRPTEVPGQHSRRLFNGCKHLAISGLEHAPEYAVRLRKALRYYDEPYPDTLAIEKSSPINQSEAGSEMATPLWFLSEERTVLKSRRQRLIFMTDEATAYYCFLFGADILEVHLVLSSVANRTPPKDALVLTVTPVEFSDPKALLERIFAESIKALKDPKREQRLARRSAL